jgi:hypothetical protein
MDPGTLYEDVFCGIYGLAIRGYFPFYCLFHFSNNKCNPLFIMNFGEYD